MKGLLSDVKEWLSTAESYCPKRSTKRTKKASGKPTVQKVRDHIAKVVRFPVDLAADKIRLEEGIVATTTWREKAREALEQVNEENEEETDPSSPKDPLDVEVLDEISESQLQALRSILVQAEVRWGWGLRVHAYSPIPYSPPLTPPEPLQSVSIHTDEEQVVERFMDVYEWCHDADVMFASGKAGIQLSDLEKAIKNGTPICYDEFNTSSAGE